MSTMGSTTKEVLPEDIEQKLAKVQEIIANLGTEKIKLEKETGDGRIELEKINQQIVEANTALNKVLEETSNKVQEIEVRDQESKKKESALNVFANALGEKEKKINKYLAIFDNMKDIIS